MDLQTCCSVIFTDTGEMPAIDEVKHVVQTAVEARRVRRQAQMVLVELLQFEVDLLLQALQALDSLSLCAVGGRRRFPSLLHSWSAC